MAIKFRYLDQSGFLLETENHILIFDYDNPKPEGGGIQDGVITPECLAGKPVYVFVSHRHHDHYNPVIFEWRDLFPDITYILSDDISVSEPVHFVSPHQEYHFDALHVRTLRSTDEGVAFLAEVDGYRIYHAGDLNWWHWEGESKAYNDKMKQDYCREIDSLQGCKPIDLAFVPVDPRLEGAYCCGARYLLETLPVRNLVPMHFWEDSSVCEKLINEKFMEKIDTKIIKIWGRGNDFCINP